MKEKLKFGFTSQGYEAPRAENVEVMVEGSLLLTASIETSGIDGGLESFVNGGTGTWDEPNP